MIVCRWHNSSSRPDERMSIQDMVLHDSGTKRALVLITDAYGGHGGIAKFNRDLLTCLATCREYGEVVALPRVVSGRLFETLPTALRFQVSSAKGAIAYVARVVQELVRNRRFHVVVCGPLHLLTLAWLVSRIAGAPLV